MYIEDKSGGLLRLHSTYRHDLKCYTSDEGRCQKTAAAFLKGLLFLEGALAPVLAIMVRNDEKVQMMLNDSSEADKLLANVKGQINQLFNAKIPIYQQYKEMFKEEPANRVRKYFEEIDVPYNKLKEIAELIAYVTDTLKDKIDGCRTSSYYWTTKDFEKIFMQDTITSKQQFE